MRGLGGGGGGGVIVNPPSDRGWGYNALPFSDGERATIYFRYKQTTDIWTFMENIQITS